MKQKLPLIARLLLGLIFTVFGANGFLNFIPVPPMPENVGQFFGALMATGYFLPLLKVTETLCGIILLAGIAVPAALVILAPIIVQIFFFHVVMTPGLSNLGMPVLLIALELTSMWHYRHLYRPLFGR